jgi:hypothetical protein
LVFIALPSDDVFERFIVFQGAVSNAVVKESDFVAYLDNVDDVPNDDEEAPVERELLNPAGENTTYFSYKGTASLLDRRKM